MTAGEAVRLPVMTACGHHTWPHQNCGDCVTATATAGIVTAETQGADGGFLPARPTVCATCHGTDWVAGRWPCLPCGTRNGPATLDTPFVVKGGRYVSPPDEV